MQNVYIVQYQYDAHFERFSVTTSTTPTQELPAILSESRRLLKESAPSDDLFIHGRDVANLLLRWGADF